MTDPVVPTPAAGTTPPAATPQTPPTPPPAAPPASPPPAAAPATSPAAAAPSTASQGPRKLTDADEPQPGEEIVLTTDALNKRMERARRKLMKDSFGVEDPAAVKANLDRLAQLEAAEEQRRKAALTETQRLQEERDRAFAERDAANERAEQIEFDRMADAEEAELRTIATEFVKPKFWRTVRQDLAEHIADSYTAEQLDQMSETAREKIVRDWLGQYVKDNPELAKADAHAQPAPAAQPLQNGVTNPAGKGGGARPAPVTQALTGKWAGKTLRPGQPNSMTNAELQQWKKETGNLY